MDLTVSTAIISVAVALSGGMALVGNCAYPSHLKSQNLLLLMSHLWSGTLYMGILLSLKQIPGGHELFGDPDLLIFSTIS